MREIKFRAWNNQDKEMYGDDVAKLLLYEEAVGKKYDKEKWVIKQFTGLQDKNGKEIYEGDIVEFRTYSTKKGKPFREAVRIEGGLLLPFYDPCYTEDEQGDWFQGDDPFEIIGNIHENPELL